MIRYRTCVRSKDWGTSFRSYELRNNFIIMTNKDVLVKSFLSPSCIRKSLKVKKKKSPTLIFWKDIPSQSINSGRGSGKRTWFTQKQTLIAKHKKCCLFLTWKKKVLLEISKSSLKFLCKLIYKRMRFI